jgi:hypothetical protein
MDRAFFLVGLIYISCIMGYAGAILGRISSLRFRTSTTQINKVIRLQRMSNPSLNIDNHFSLF